MFFMEGGAPAPAPPQSRLASTAAAPVPAQQVAAEGPIDLDADPPSALLEPQHPAEAVGTAPPNQQEVQNCLQVLCRSFMLTVLCLL